MLQEHCIGVAGKQDTGYAWHWYQMALLLVAIRKMVLPDTGARTLLLVWLVIRTLLLADTGTRRLVLADDQTTVAG